MYLRTALPVSLALLFTACEEQAERAAPATSESTGTLASIEGNLSRAEVRVPSNDEVQALLSLEEQIVQQPNDAAVRRSLGEKAIDRQANIIWTVGKARIQSTARPYSVALNQAELAAQIDASRWAAYVLEWERNQYASDFGSIRGRVPGSTVESKSVTDSTCIVLARTPLSN